MIQPLQTLQADLLPVRVYRTQAEMAAEAAVLAAETLRAALGARGEARAILASATSQIQFLDALVRTPDLDWSRVTLFHMDEYLGVPDTHPASFRRFLRERVELRCHPRAFHYLRGDAPEPLKEVERYRALLAEAPIDLCCLGIGENGHVAFNDPPVADFNDPFTVKLVQLDEACRRQQVGEGCFPTLEAVPQYAYTLTIPALCAAAKMVCVVPERRKAAAVRATIQGPLSTACPASILRRKPHCTLFLDADSASLL
ncbi:MAG: glucosamine-6-phosphate deaminase [Verrucomicrobia bacterium]|nr:glucosamine-6-phosphate deaminase [Verrucomicrobiota bacterium]